MPGNKDRLYVGLHARGGQPKMPGLEDKYHWSFIVGPKVESEQAQGVRFHAKNEITMVDGSYRSVWKYESKTTFLLSTDVLLVRIMIGKVINMHRLVSAFEQTPVRGDEPGYEHWNCVEWIKEALTVIEKDQNILGTSAINWNSVRNAAMWYIEKKKAEHRFDGQGESEERRVPTWSLLEKRELIS